MDETFTVLIMMPPHGPSPGEKWVSKGIQAAGLDLIVRLKKLDVDLTICVLAAEEQDRRLAQQHGVRVFKSSKETFHFGKAFTDFILEQNVENVAYFGSGSAPLLRKEVLEEIFIQALRSKGPYAVVNNLHSTDWAMITQAKNIQGIGERFHSDNPVGWVLLNELGYEVETLPAFAGTRTDIDTPSDLLMMQGHPDLGPNLRAFYSRHPMHGIDQVKDVLAVLSTPASHLTLIGRASSQVWRELERKTQIWIRMFVEERGMVASGRMQQGEVRSLIAEILDEWGPDRFIRYLESISDAVLWDTRVWMAHHGGWPSKSDRFAADLSLVDEINDVALKGLTKALHQSKIPIISGGHGVVAGGLYALLETAFPD
jgi:CTP:molybdopterin cytidylyltransferase MocA